MSNIEQILLLCLSALPYVAVFVYLMISGKIKEFSFSTLCLGAFDILLAVAVGAVGGFLIITGYPQTGSTLSNSYLIGLLAAFLGIALIAGEGFRILMLKRNAQSDESNSSVAGLAFGVGCSLGEFIFFAAVAIMNWGEYIRFDSAMLIMVDVLIQILVSIAAYELIKQGNFASVAVGGVYYLSLFFAYVFSSSIVLNIVSRVVMLGIAVALAITFLPERQKN